jgi:hypothetical protein
MSTFWAWKFGVSTVSKKDASALRARRRDGHRLGSRGDGAARRATPAPAAHPVFAPHDLVRWPKAFDHAAGRGRDGESQEGGLSNQFLDYYVIILSQRRKKRLAGLPALNILSCRSASACTHASAYTDTPHARPAVDAASIDAATVVRRPVVGRTTATAAPTAAPPECLRGGCRGDGAERGERGSSDAKCQQLFHTKCSLKAHQAGFEVPRRGNLEAIFQGGPLVALIKFVCELWLPTVPQQARDAGNARVSSLRGQGTVITSEFANSSSREALSAKFQFSWRLVHSSQSQCTSVLFQKFLAIGLFL